MKKISERPARQNKNFKKNVVFYANLLTTMGVVLTGVAFTIGASDAQGIAVSLGAIWFCATSSYLLITNR